MRANSVVQTGPNTQAGGLSAGLTRAGYQVGMDGTVKKEPIIPADSETIIAMTSLNRLFIFMILFINDTENIVDVYPV